MRFSSENPYYWNLLKEITFELFKSLPNCDDDIRGKEMAEDVKLKLEHILILDPSNEEARMMLEETRTCIRRIVLNDDQLGLPILEEMLSRSNEDNFGAKLENVCSCGNRKLSLMQKLRESASKSYWLMWDCDDDIREKVLAEDVKSKSEHLLLLDPSDKTARSMLTMSARHMEGIVLNDYVHGSPVLEDTVTEALLANEDAKLKNAKLKNASTSSKTKHPQSQQPELQHQQQQQPQQQLQRQQMTHLSHHQQQQPLTEQQQFGQLSPFGIGGQHPQSQQRELQHQQQQPLAEQVQFGQLSPLGIGGQYGLSGVNRTHDSQVMTDQFFNMGAAIPGYLIPIQQQHQQQYGPQGVFGYFVPYNPYWSYGGVYEPL